VLDGAVAVFRMSEPISSPSGQTGERAAVSSELSTAWA
jgi:hypothetical protein